MRIFLKVKSTTKFFIIDILVVYLSNLMIFLLAFLPLSIKMFGILFLYRVATYKCQVHYQCI